MIHQLNLHDKPFQSIKSGLKTIEMRLHDEKKSLIQIGDEILFTNNVTKEQLEVEVIDIYLYKDFEELYNHHDKKDLGYLANEIANPEDMLVYYTKEKIKKYGVMGIKIRKKK